MKNFLLQSMFLFQTEFSKILYLWGGAPGEGCSFPQGTNYEGACCWRFAMPEEWKVKPQKTSFYDPKNDIQKCAAHIFDPIFTHCNFQRYDIVRTYDEYGWNNLWTVCGIFHFLFLNFLKWAKTGTLRFYEKAEVFKTHSWFWNPNVWKLLPR